MTTKELRAEFQLTQKDLAENYNIPLRTVQNWDSRDCMPEYLYQAIYSAECYKKNYFNLKSCIEKNLSWGVEMYDLPECFDE